MLTDKTYELREPQSAVINGLIYGLVYSTKFSSPLSSAFPISFPSSWQKKERDAFVVSSGSEVGQEELCQTYPFHPHDATNE